MSHPERGITPTAFPVSSPLRPSGGRGRGPSRSDGRVRWVWASALESPTSPQSSPPPWAERGTAASAGLAARFDGLGLDPVIGVEPDQVLDFLAQSHEFGIADSRVAAGRQNLAERPLHRVERGAEQDLRVDAAAVPHRLEVPEREDRPAVAIAAALDPDERHARQT